jgi:hypothetical protein
MNLTVQSPRLPAMSDPAIAVARALEERVRGMEQVPISTHHQIHGLMYTRTICLPKGAVLVGVLIKVPTTLIVSGDASVFIGDDEIRVTGFAVIPGSAGRKQAFIAHQDTYLSMSFQTTATTVEEAESQFTDEADSLFSRQSTTDVTIITGE